MYAFNRLVFVFAALCKRNSLTNHKTILNLYKLTILIIKSELLGIKVRIMGYKLFF